MLLKLQKECIMLFLYQTHIFIVKIQKKSIKGSENNINYIKLHVNEKKSTNH